MMKFIAQLKELQALVLRLEARIAELEARLALLEERRGPGRPRKEEYAA